MAVSQPYLPEKHHKGNKFELSEIKDNKDEKMKNESQNFFRYYMAQETKTK
jgi:hypothetical protein